MNKHAFLLNLAVLVSASSLSLAAPLGTAFTYQGQLGDGGAPATGIYDLRFTIYDLAADGNAVGGPVTSALTAVSNGLFTVTLDFGAAAFMGDARWLEIGVRTNGSPGAHTALVPRQPVTPTPYAFHAVNAANLMSFANAPLDIKVNGQRALRLELTASNSFYRDVVNVIGGSPVNFVAPGVIGATIAGGGNGTSFGAPDANSISASFGTISGGEINTIAMGAAFSTIAGGQLNTIQGGSLHSAIGGGFGNTNQANAFGGTIGGGGLNLIGPEASLSTIAGGEENTIQFLADHSTISGGNYNTIETNAFNSTIGGGQENDIAADSFYATIVGGAFNDIGTNSGASAIGGGQYNRIAPNASASTIAGGQFNVVGTNSAASTIGGGYGNNIAEFAGSSTIAGGQLNVIGTNAGGSAIGGGVDDNIGAFSFSSTIAGGRFNAIQPFTGSSTIGGGEDHKVETDAIQSTISGGSENIIRSSARYGTIGGGRDNTIEPGGEYGTIPGGRHNCAFSYAFAAGHRARAIHIGSFVWGDSMAEDIASTNVNSVTFRASGGTRIFSDSNATAGVFLAPGSGSWTAMSDRHAKENFHAVDSREVLERVARLPVQTWNYKSQDAAIRHLGPMAQDFKAAFGLGEGDTGITTVDADGVVLAAIQGLNQKLAQGLKQRDAENAELKQRLIRLEALVSRTAGERP